MNEDHRIRPGEASEQESLESTRVAQARVTEAALGSNKSALAEVEAWLAAHRTK